MFAISSKRRAGLVVLSLSLSLSLALALSVFLYLPTHTIPRLSGESDLLVASDSGEVEVWNCHQPGYTLEYKSSLGSHDDMVLCLCRTADPDRVLSAGADSK